MLTRISDEEIVETLNCCYGNKNKPYVTKAMASDEAIAQAQLEADQEKVQEIFGLIELIILGELNQNLNNYPWWQALKERMGEK